MTAVGNRIVLNPLFKQLVAWFVKRHVGPTIKEYRWAHFYPETVNIDETGLPLLASRSSLVAVDTQESSNTCFNLETSNIKAENKI